jgi:predicted DNA-binding transcriptional regulator AlpA
MKGFALHDCLCGGGVESRSDSQAGDGLVHHTRFKDEKTMIPDVELQLLTKEEVLGRVKMSYTTVWKKMQAGTFPRCYMQGNDSEKNRVYWYAHEIDAYLADLCRKPLKGDAKSPVKRTRRARA